MSREELDLSRVAERLLLVDDEETILALLGRQMTLFGLKFDAVVNGRDALELLKRRDYGLVITDILMPVMDGMELMLNIKEDHPKLDVLVVSGHTREYSFTDLIAAGATDFINKPFEGNELKAKLQRIFRERLLLADLQNSREKEKEFFLHIVESLAISLDEKDEYTHGHSRRVTNLSLQLAEHVTAEVVDMELLRLSGVLHDIGKIGVPDSVLSKPGRLTEDEFAIIKKHPEQGAHILQPMGSDKRIAHISTIIRHHHERYDGKGYPDGLRAQEIPLLSRIIAIADTYDAMTSDRPYRKGMDVNIAIEEIRKNKGSQFDPELAEQFICFMKDCQDGMACPSQNTCRMFALIKNNTVSKAYEMQFCRANFRSCARYKISDKEERPENLLPDGSFL